MPLPKQDTQRRWCLPYSTDDSQLVGFLDRLRERLQDRQSVGHKGGGPPRFGDRGGRNLRAYIGSNPRFGDRGGRNLRAYIESERRALFTGCMG